MTDQQHARFQLDEVIHAPVRFSIVAALALDEIGLGATCQHILAGFALESNNIAVDSEMWRCDAIKLGAGPATLV